MKRVLGGFIPFASALLSTCVFMIGEADAKTWRQCYADSGRRCAHPYAKVGYKCCLQSKSSRNAGYECVKECDRKKKNNSNCVNECKVRKGVPVFVVR